MTAAPPEGRHEQISGAPQGGVPADTPRRYRKRPIVVEAVQWHGEDWPERDVLWWPHTGVSMVYDKLHNSHGSIEHGDWIITGPEGEHYPVKAHIFAATYEAVDADAGSAQASVEAPAEAAAVADVSLRVTEPQARPTETPNDRVAAPLAGPADPGDAEIVAEMVPCADCGAKREHCGCDMVAALDEVWGGIVKASDGCPVPTATCQDRCGPDRCELDAAIRALHRQRAASPEPQARPSETLPTSIRGLDPDYTTEKFGAVAAPEALRGALREYVRTHSRVPLDSFGTTFAECDCALCDDARAALSGDLGGTPQPDDASGASSPLARQTDADA